MTSSTRARWAAVLTISLSVSSLFLLVAPRASASAGDRVGFAAGWLFGSNQSDVQAQMRRVSSIGARWLRIDFNWQSVEATQGMFDWSRPDAVMAAAAAEGVNVLPIIGYGTSWAGSPPVDHLDAYANYAGKVAERYGPGGPFWQGKSQTLPITAVEVYNEPHGFWFWPDQATAPTVYASMVRKTSAAVKARSPQVQILADAQEGKGGGLGPWIAAVLDADPGLPTVVEGWAIHPYPWLRNGDPTNGDCIPQVDRVWNLLLGRNAAKPLWITEIGWSTQASEGPSDYVSESQQASYVSSFVSSMLARAQVRAIFVYGYGPDGTSPDRESHYGTHHNDWTPKPVWGALANLLATSSPASSTSTSSTTTTSTSTTTTSTSTSSTTTTSSRPSTSSTTTTTTQPRTNNRGGRRPPGTTLSQSLYFAEGYTGRGFQEYLTILNPSDAAADVAVTYQFPSGDPIVRHYKVGPRSRSTMDVNHEVGPDREVGMHISSSVPVAAERPVYFTYRGVITGGSTSSGVDSPGTTWYFAEGHVGDGFDEYLTLANPNDSPALVSVSYLLPGAAPLTRNYTVSAGSRRTVKVNDEVPSGDVSVAISADQPVVAERPLYFLYDGTYMGGSSNTGAPALSTDWQFAEGYTGAGFREYITVANPSAAVTAHVDIRYHFPDGSEATQPVAVAPQGRSTVLVNAATGDGHEVSTYLHSDVPVVAERPLYTSFKGVRSGTVGAGSSEASTGWLFAEGYTGLDFDEFLTLGNPQDVPLGVTVRYIFNDGTSSTRDIVVGAHARSTVIVKADVGPNREVGLEVTAPLPFVAERTMYFLFRGAPGASTVTGARV